MNIGIIGSGNVGGTLGTRWAKRRPSGDLWIALLWISLAFKAGLGREFAFKLLRR
jgi:predicted dinucleotide-binding enzyme